MRGFWPQQHDDTTGVTDHLDSVSKYVISRTLEDPSWAGTTILTGDVTDEVAKLKSMPGKDIVVTGSITLVQELVRLDLPDEYRLFVYPVVVGGDADSSKPTTASDRWSFSKHDPSDRASCSSGTHPQGKSRGSGPARRGGQLAPRKVTVTGR